MFENNKEIRASKVNFLTHLRTIFIHMLSRNHVWYACMDPGQFLKQYEMRFTKPKLSPWQLYHIMQYLLNEDVPQVVFLSQGNLCLTKH